MGNHVVCNPAVNVTLPGTNATVTVGSDDPGWYLLAGMGFTLLSALAVSLGTVLQKKAHVSDLALPPELRAPRKGGVLCTPMWMFGFLIMAFLQIPLSFAALALAPQSIVIPLGAGATIVFTQILAVCVLKEPLGRLEVAATLLIVGGILLTTTANSGGPSHTLSTCGILTRYTEVDFDVPMILAMVGILLAVVALHYNKVRPRMQPIVYAFIAGFLGAILNIMLKVVGEFTQSALANDPEGRSVWGTILPYIHILALIVMAVGQISFINQGLERFPAVSFLPVYNCLFIVSATLLGALFFREFDDFGAKAVIMFTFGVSVTVGGIALISCGGTEAKVRGENEWEGEMENFGNVQMRPRGPSDPLEPNYFDADLSWDEKAFADAPTLQRLVLI